MPQVGIQFDSDEAMRHAHAVLKDFPAMGPVEAYSRDDLARWIHTAATETGDDPISRPGRPSSPDPVIWIHTRGQAETVAEQLRKRRSDWDIGANDAKVVIANPCAL